MNLMIREKQFSNRSPIVSQSIIQNILKINFMSAIKLGENTNNILNSNFSKQIYTLVYQTKYVHIEN